MRCNKCGTESPDTIRFCPVCGHKLQSGHRAETPPETDSDGHEPADTPRALLNFQGWTRPARGSGRYVEACVYALILAAGVAWCVWSGITWPLYPLIGILGLIAWLRRL